MRIAMSALVLVCLATPALTAECAKKSYGGGVTLAESTPVAVLVDAAEEHVGRKVRVEGTVVDVCEKAGCWMEIRAQEGEQIVKVKVKDGEIVFPTAARGKSAVAEGTFERREMDRAQYVAHLEHLADEQGREFDASTLGEGPFRVYQIAGTGAEICAD